MKTKVYFAAPLFNVGEKSFNSELTDILEDAGYDVFLPQRDGHEAATMRGSQAEKVNQIFKKDTAAIDKSDVIVMVLDGRVPDEGACVELGYGYAKGKRCYGIKTDTRSLQVGLDLNPLIWGCFRDIIHPDNEKSIFETFKQYLDEHKL